MKKNKVFEIVSRKALTKCPLLHGNMQKETDKDIEKVFSETSGGCVIPVRNNFLNDSK